MPTYVYRCESCSNKFELVQRMVDDPIDTCPDCAGKVRRVIHPVGVVFKGSGWYINDSRSNNASKDSSETASDSETSSSKETSDKDSTSKPVAASTDKVSTDKKKSDTSTSKTAAD